MEAKGIICIMTGTPPSDPETAERFYKWHDDVHILHLFEFKGMRKATNCRLIIDLEPLHPTDVKYPAFLTIFEYESKEASQQYLTSPERAAATKDAQSTWPPEVGGKKIWSVLYEPIKTFGNRTETKTKGILNIIAGTPPSDPETVERFYKWHNDEHIHQLLRFKGIRKATNYKLVTDLKPFYQTDINYPAFITILEYESKEAIQKYLTSPERASAKEDGIATWGEHIGAQKIWSVLYEPTKIWER